MSHQPLRPRGITSRPGRLVAVASAAVICLLSVSGALGLSLAGGLGSTTKQEALAGGGLPGDAALIDASRPDSTPTTPAQTTTPTTPAAGQHSDSTPPADPALPANSGQGRRIVFGVAQQRVWLVAANGSVERTYLVSGSKYDNLDLGTYHVYSRSLDATAYNSDERMRYMVRFAVGHTSAPIGFHSIPMLPNGKLVETRAGLGAAASDGCVRQWITDAKALWDFAPVGTTVVVHA